MLTVAVLLYRDRGGEREVLLLRRNAERGPHRWVPAGGRVEPGESGADAAAREVGEETGLDVLGSLVSLECSYDFERDGRSFHEEAFACATAADWVPRLDPAEHDGFAWLPLAEAERRIAWPENRAAFAALAARPS